MKAEVVAMDAEHLNMEAIQKAGKILREGGLVAFPTETVYGLGGNALDPKASMKIYAAKGRPSDNPLIVHIADIKDLAKITTEIPEGARILAEKYWPGPLTMILPKADSVPKETTGGLDSVAVRFPSDRIAQELIKAAGGFVAAPSANTSGRPSPTMAEHVEEDLGDAIEMIIDGGQVGIGLESTIVDFTEDVPVVLRPGYISLEMLKDTLGDVRMDRGLLITDSSVHPKAPGMKYRHYAPNADVILVAGCDSDVEKYMFDRSDDSSVAFICFDEYHKLAECKNAVFIGSECDLDQQARKIFDILREFDSQPEIKTVYAKMPSQNGIGLAIYNRLLKAAGYRIIRI